MEREPLTVRRYGTTGPFVFVLHGGPGAPGHMAPVARGLSDVFQVLEPWQRGSGCEPLSVARHVEDLHDLVTTWCRGARPGLVGSSWGAMLALAYAAAHPGATGPLALIGCGTFDPMARERFHATVRARMDDRLQNRLARLPDEYPDRDARLEALGDLLLPIYSYEPITADTGTEAVDARAYEETWADMLRLQAEGVYPAAFQAINAPVIMLHGAADPHPGPMIRATLSDYLPQLEYREWRRCGHYPWLERFAQSEFFRVLRDWLQRHLLSSGRSRTRDAEASDE